VYCSGDCRSIWDSSCIRRPIMAPCFGQPTHIGETIWARHCHQLVSYQSYGAIDGREFRTNCSNHVVCAFSGFTPKASQMRCIIQCLARLTCQTLGVVIGPSLPLVWLHNPPTRQRVSFFWVELLQKWPISTQMKLVRQPASQALQRQPPGYNIFFFLKFLRPYHIPI
jgi:hypothetical protein